MAGKSTRTARQSTARKKSAAQVPNNLPHLAQTSLMHLHSLGMANSTSTSAQHPGLSALADHATSGTAHAVPAAPETLEMGEDEDEDSDSFAAIIKREQEEVEAPAPTSTMHERSDDNDNDNDDDDDDGDDDDDYGESESAGQGRSKSRGQRKAQSSPSDGDGIKEVLPEDIPETPLGIIKFEGIRFSYRTPKGRVRKKKVRLCCFDEQCVRASRGASGLCIAHGGGKRCVFPGCTNGAENGGLMLHCKRHGGGKRCQRPGCTKSARASTPFCIKHGGGKRCEKPGCVKAAIGATMFCVAHGGGKRCAYKDGCTKSTQGASKYCKRHTRVVQVESGKLKDECATHKCKLSVYEDDVCVLHGSRGSCLVSSCDVKTTRTSYFCRQHARLELIVAGGLTGRERLEALCSWAIAQRNGEEAATSLLEGLDTVSTTLGPSGRMVPGPGASRASASFVAKELLSSSANGRGDDDGADGDDDDPLASLQAQLIRQQKQLEKLRQLQLQKDAIVAAFQNEQLLAIHQQQAEVLREVENSMRETEAHMDKTQKRFASGELTVTTAPKRARQDEGSSSPDSGGPAARGPAADGTEASGPMDAPPGGSMGGMLPPPPPAAAQDRGLLADEPAEAL